jgi:hypothetical protein
MLTVAGRKWHIVCGPRLDARNEITTMKCASAVSLAAVSASAIMALAGCVSLSGRVRNRENLLAAAGFDMHLANTSRREAALKSLPANRFVTRAKGDHMEYFYADPLVCNCLYTGDQKAFDAYKHEVFQRRIADEQQLTAQMYHEPAGWWEGWSWGPWGWPGPPWW